MIFSLWTLPHIKGKRRLSWETRKIFLFFRSTQVWQNVTVCAPEKSHTNRLSLAIPLLGYWGQKVEHVLWDQPVDTDESSAEAFISCRWRNCSLHLRQATGKASFLKGLWNKWVTQWTTCDHCQRSKVSVGKSGRSDRRTEVKIKHYLIYCCSITACIQGL